MTVYTKEDVEKWYGYYLSTKSTRKTAEAFNVSRPTVKRLFRKFGLVIDGSAKKYFFDDDFFFRDTPESFYWAGFVAADGCIVEGKTSKRIVLCLSVKDIGHLEKLKNAIHHLGPIHIYDERPIRNSVGVRFEISSLKMVGSLQRFNIGPRKSLTYEFPEWLISHSLVNHFIRGYNDGDGCFFCSQNSSQIGCKIRGTKQCLEAIRFIFGENCKTNKELKILFNSNIYQIMFNGRNSVVRIRDFLYRDSNQGMELDRKREIAFGIEESHREVPVISTDLDGRNEVFYESQSAAEKDGFSSSRVCYCVNGKNKKHKNRLFRKATEEEIQKYSKETK